MKTFSLAHLSDPALLRDCETIHARERGIAAVALAHLAEVDARRLYTPAGYSSMYDYCVARLHLSEQAAMKRIRAARTARRFPAIFEAVAEARLHLSAVVLLAPYLRPDNGDELLAAAAHQTKDGIEQMLARRFPKPDLPTRLEPLVPPPPVPAIAQLSPGTVGPDAAQLSPGTVGPDASPLIPEPADAAAVAHQLAPAHVEAGTTWPKVKPLSSERFGLQVTIGRPTHDKLRHAQALLSHQIPSGDVAEVLDRALDALIANLERAKFAATDQPRRGRRHGTPSSRHIPAAVKRAVWDRDGGQCTFVSETGHRCEPRRMLEFDHMESVCRGGQATVSGIRLCCRAHNQYEAERMFGAGFMTKKRQAAQRAAAARARAATRQPAEAHPEPAAKARTEAAPTKAAAGALAMTAREEAACVEAAVTAQEFEAARAWARAAFG